MLARSRTFAMPSDAAIDTPLLIPSFSSRGFRFRQDGLSEVATYIEAMSASMPDALLVSAYDLAHGHLPAADQLLGGSPWSSPYANPKLLVIDSGGFELGSVEDGQGSRAVDHPKSFSEHDFEVLVDRLPTDMDQMVVSYDHVETGTKRPDYADQAAAAADLYQRRPDVMSDLLLRPPESASYVDANAVVDAAADLGAFDVLGFTDRELGSSMLARLVAVAQIRHGLDEAGCEAPIHVFGVLDPVVVTLYFIAGAEVFDGLTWIRYGYHNGIGAYRDSASILNGHLDVPAEEVGAISQLEYLSALRTLKRELTDWCHGEGQPRLLANHPDVVDEVTSRIRDALGGDV